MIWWIVLGAVVLFIVWACSPKDAKLPEGWWAAPIALLILIGLVLALGRCTS